jgi:Ku C terminal domain like
MFQYDEPRLYNEYIQSLKKDLLDGKLDGNRQDFWKLMKSEKVGLVTFEETEVDQIEDISEREAEKVIFIRFLDLILVLGKLTSRQTLNFLLKSRISLFNTEQGLRDNCIYSVDSSKNLIPPILH